MFRKSKREKERRGSSFTSNSENEEGAGNTNSLKRHSKLFSFGKKDKKKNHNTNGHESPEISGTDGIRIDEAFADKSQKVSGTPNNSAAHHMKTVMEENSQRTPIPKDKLVEKNIDKGFKRNNSVTSRGSSLAFDFGTDNSLAFTNFTADVLRATEEKLQGVDLQLPALKRMLSSDNSRLINVKRSKAGDFGIALRRSTMSKNDNKIIHMVEPSNNEVTFGLLPGDKLIEVNGVNVETLSREDIIEKVAASGNAVSLKVVPVPEFSELSSRTAVVQSTLPNRSPSLARSSSFMRRKTVKTAKSDEVLDSEKQWLEAEKVWFLHPKGFSSGLVNRSRKENDDYHLKLKLDHGGEVLEVEEDTVEKINPPKFDRVEDLSTLQYLNLSGCLHTLRQRYAGNLTHTYAGNHVVIIKPKHKLGIYANKVKEMFQGCKQEDMPPHIYAVAQTAYRSMMANHKNQSIIFQGNSGSGKTFNLKQVVKYFTTLLISKETNANAGSMSACFSVIESFTQCRTLLSKDASYGRMLYTLDFDNSGFLIGATVNQYYLNKYRIVKPPYNESSYRIFYELFYGCDKKMREELFLNALPKDGNLLFDLEKQFDSIESYQIKWKHMQETFEMLNITKDEMKGMMAPLAAIFFLGAAGVSAGTGSKPYFLNPSHAQKAAIILGTTEEGLARLIFSTSSQLSSRSRSSSTVSRSNSATSRTSMTSNTLSPSGSVFSGENMMYDLAVAAVQGFCTGLYIESFTALLRLVNRSLNTTSRVGYMLHLLDGPGFQNKSCIQKDATVEDLFTNYCCERLQWLQYFNNFTSKVERFNRENIDCKYDISELTSPDETITVFDKLTMDRRVSMGDFSERKGLLWIIEDEALRSNSNEFALVDRIKGQHPQNNGTSVVLTDEHYPDIFIVSHLQNTVPIKYNVTGWLKNVREHPAIRTAYSILSDSKKSYISDLYSQHQSGTYQTDHTVTHHGRSHNRKNRSISTVASTRKNSVSMQIKSQMDQLLEVIEQTHIQFVYCILPETTNGLVDPEHAEDDSVKDVATFDIPFVAQQLRSGFLLQSMRMHRQGYPDFMSFSEFLRRFDILLSEDDKIKGPILDEKQAVAKTTDVLDLEGRSYKLGLSNIFFRAGILAQLEDTRDDKLSHTITDFQALCRGYMARKEVKKLQFQRAAITCLQRNVRKFLLVRNWSWWRLYTKVLPLLDVHRTEQELKTKTDELGGLKQKIDKLTNDNQTFEDENSRLKKKVQDLSHQLSEIHSTASGASDLLEEESFERQRLEEELEKAKMETMRLSQQRTMLENELCDMKLNGMNGNHYEEAGDDELIENDNVWREKYKALHRELETTRRKINDQAEEEIQELMNQKRSAEKSLAEERAETDEVRRQLTNSKRKLNKFVGEMDDMKLLLEGLQGRNSELEKKQRKFDHDMTNLGTELEQEVSIKESAERERDKLTSEKHALTNQINSYQDEVGQYKRKVERLHHEIDESATSGTSDVEMVTLKRQLREQESKLNDQEEELDEQAGQIQQLEQAKLKLEMASQRDKQQFQRDIEAKDEEIEQVKTDQTRKIRSIEEQIDDEVHKKEEANRVKRDLERKIFDLQNTADEGDRGTDRKYRKELKKLRILYKDAKAALDNQKGKQTDQGEVKALRSQLEDSEFAKHMAIKSKQQIELDMEELNTQIDNLTRSKESVEERCLSLSRDNGDLQTRIDESEDEIEDVIRTNKQLIAQLSEVQAELVSMREKYRNLEEKNDILTQKVTNLTNKLDHNEKQLVDKLEVERSDLKIRELEHKLENEGQTRIKLEHQCNRLKGQLERIQDEKTELQNNQSRIQQNVSRSERQVKDIRVELESLQRQEVENKRRREEAENRVQLIEDEVSRKKNEVISAEKRIRVLQESIEQEMNGSSDEDDTFIDEESDDSLSMSFNRNQNRSSFSTRRRRSLLTKKLSTDSFDTPMASYRPRRSISGDDNYASSNGIAARDASKYTSRTGSRVMSAQISRQSSID